MSVKKRVVIFSLIFSLPITIFFTVWLYHTANTYLKIDHLNQPFTKNSVIKKGVRLKRVGLLEFMELKASIKEALGLYHKSDVNIFIKNSDLKQLNQNLPVSGFKEKKAFLFIGDSVVKGKVRYRGDNWYHWLMPHKSWRFKTSKNDLYQGVRKYNFIIPKSTGLLANHQSYKLARIMGLLAPESSMKTLSVNKKYNGMKLMVEQIDESFLRNNGRMPNDIYKGDNMGSAKHVGVRISSIFDVSAIWDKASINNHYSKSSVAPLDELLKQLGTNNQLMDKKSFSRFMVFVDLTSSFHYDAQHNWILYYDNYYEKFYPIVWDTMGWQKAWTDKQSVNIIHSSKLFESLYSDYEFLKLKYYELYGFFNTKEGEFLDGLNDEIQKVKDKINIVGYDYSAGGSYRNSEQVNKKIDDFRERIINRFSLVKKSFVSGIDKSNYKYMVKGDVLRLSVSGSKLINKVVIDMNMNISQGINNIYLSYLQNGQKIRVDIPFIINGEKQIELDVDLLARLTQVKGKPFPRSTSIEYKTAIYDIEGLDTGNVKSVIFSMLTLNNENVQVRKVKNIIVTEFGSQKNIISKQTAQKQIIWSGIKEFDGFNLIKDDVFIQPGTKLVFKENATIKVLGKITAIGTKDKPITFEAQDKTKPWNAFVLKDEKANGSIFKYCIFKDGSGDKGKLYEYTAMFSVHNVEDLLVENCEFYDSHRTDDMVHVIYSTAKFKNTKFIRSLSDALDVDLSEVLVDGCEFIDSGNDAIDLMTTNAVVINTKFINSKDKAISIGEGSNLLAINNLIKESGIGMQSKDTSKAYVYNTSFLSNKKAVDAYHKNWRYSSGGEINLDKCKFEDNLVNITIGKKSLITVNNSAMNENFDKKLLKNKLIISNDSFLEPDLSKINVNDYIGKIQRERMGYFYGN